MKKPALACALVLAACGGKAHPSAGGSVCPGPDRVAIGEWVAGDTPAGWRVFLSTQEGPENAEASYAAIPLDQLKAGGVTAPTAVWLYAPGQPPCKATVTGGFRQVVNEGPVSTQLGVETTGCAAPRPDDAQLIYALLGDEDFAGCTMAMTKEVAHRAGTEVDDKWVAPTDAAPIPAEVSALLPAHACDAPGCVPLWSVAKTEDNSAYTATRTWMHPVLEPTEDNPTPDGSACSIPHDDETDVYVDAGHGLAAITWPEDRWAQTLEGVFRDAGGPRLLILDNTGTFDVYQVTPTGTSRARSVRWYHNNEEDSHYNSLAPYCGP
jgi:hypothetical protein